MATPNYNVNYDDKRFTEVEADKKAALNEVDVTYGNMVSNSDQYYQAQIDASQKWAEQQSQIQQEKTDFAIEQIEQQKQQAQKDYTKEQSGAYVDWQKQSNPYGANAERVAAQGMDGTGYSESAQVSMYNTYQNRVATARESYARAVLNYDNAIKDARLQNNAALAEIAYQALQQQLELSLQGFQYKNQLIIEQSNKKLEVDNTYYQRYQDVLNQINQENALAEEVRQYNESMAFETEQARLEREFKAEQAKLDRAHDMALLKAKTKAEKELVGYEYTQKQKQMREEYRLQQAAAAQKAASSKKAVTNKNTKSSISGGSSNVVKSGQATTVSQKDGGGTAASAVAYLEALIASGASEDRVANEIALARRNGAITDAEALKLQNAFTPRGVRY